MNEPTAFKTHELFALNGSTALITGAAHGLGFGIATALASAGVTVVLFDRDGDALAAAHEAIGGSPHVAIQGDVTNGDDVARAIRTVESELASLDVLVNGAAIYPTGTLEQVSDEEFASVFDVNVAGYRRFIRGCLPLLAESQAASIVNIASITMYLGIPPNLSSYISTKAAVVGLTRAAARELGPQGIRVNAIAPGSFATRARLIIEDRTEYDQYILDSQSIKRRGRVEDVAAAVMFLAAPASSFITGQTLVVDGGWSFH